MSESLQPLDLEMQTYRNHKDALLTSSEGKFVLIHGASILGTFATKMDAVAAGHQRVGPGPFLVKKVERGKHWADSGRREDCGP